MKKLLGLSKLPQTLSLGLGVAHLGLVSFIARAKFKSILIFFAKYKTKTE